MAGTSTTIASRRAGADLLGIYLNDHLAGATAGTQLARRVAKSHQNGPDGSVLAQFAKDVADDRASLVRIMSTLGIAIRTYKVYALISRAERQAELLEEIRRHAADRVIRCRAA